ncbi:MAG: hypothetical protein V4523_07940 [Pseudomonadota bacterium]
MHQSPNPLFAKASEIFAAPGQSLPSTCSDRPRPTSRTIPAKVRDLIAKLGLRYRPTSQSDLEAHAGQLAMLASDLHDIPADLLESAISEWATRSPYMPKAFDLIQLAKGYLPKPAKPNASTPNDWESKAHAANDALGARPDGRRDIRWVATHEGIELQFDQSYRSPFDKFIDRLDGYEIDQREVDRMPERWRKIAEERGYLRRMDDGQFVIRQRPSILAGL